MAGIAVSGIRMVHGLADELVPADWPAITLDEVRPVLAAFELHAVAVTWQSPRPLSAAALVAAEDRTVFVKRHSHLVRSAEALAEEHAFAAHLGSCGVPVPPVLRTRRGGSVVRHGGWMWEVHERGRGNDLYRDTLSWQPFFSVTHAFGAGAALAFLASAGATYAAPAREPHALAGSWAATSSADLLAGLSAFVAERPQLASALGRWDWKADVARDLGPLHLRLAPLLGQLPEGWTHGDGHASNLLWDADGSVSAVLDLGLSDRTTPLLDLATAIERNAVSWLDAQPQARFDIVDALVRGWVSVRPLLGVEAAALPELVPLVHTDFALTELWYFDAITRSPDNAAVAYQDYLLGHARWHAGPHGRDLHRHLQALVARLG